MDIKKVAELARLQITQEEEVLFNKQLNSIVDYFAELDSVDTKGVDPLVTPIELEAHWRKDEAEVSLNTEEALANAPEKMGNLFKVPPVV